MGYHLLLIEKEPPSPQSPSLTEHLEKQGHHLTITKAVENIADLLQTFWPDLIILHGDVAPTDLLELSQHHLGQDKIIPCLIITAHTLTNLAPSIHLYLLEDDQSYEPVFNQIDQLLDNNRFLRSGHITLDQWAKRLMCHNTIHHLTPKLVKLLALLMQNEGDIVSRKQIMQEIWETDYMGDTRTLDVHIRWIREKIEDNPSQPVYLKTVRRAGYCFKGIKVNQ